MRKIFITGAASALGEKLVQNLEEKYEVTALEHRTAVSKSAKIKIVSGGLDNISHWQKYLDGQDIVIHLAGLTHAKNQALYEKVNAEGTKALLQVCKQHGIEHFVFISTRAIGQNCGAYGASKESAEGYVTESGLPYTILRPGEVYDEKFQTKEGIGMIASLIDTSPVIPYFGNDNITMSPVHIDDAVQAIVSAIDNPKALNKTYTVAGPENLPMKKLIERICAYKKIRRISLPIPNALARLIFYIGSRVFGKPSPDQLQRFVCAKETLSNNVLSDLYVQPRGFLAKTAD